MTLHWLVCRAAALALFAGPAVGHAVSHSGLVRAIRIEGTQRPLDLSVQPGEPFNKQLIEQEVRRLWQTGWFDDIQVRADTDSSGTVLTFAVQEKRRFYLREVRVDPDDFRLPWKLETGSPIDFRLARQFAAKVRRQFREDGHASSEVTATLVPVGAAQADLHLHVEKGDSFSVGEVLFAGSHDIPPKQLQRKLRALRSRRILPGIPGFWKGWRLRPPLDNQRIDADVERLRSFYVAQGYFEARVRAGTVELGEGRAAITMEVEAGPRFRVKRITLPGLDSHEIATQVDGRFPARELCRCLLQARRKAEAEGRLDFSSRIDIASAADAALGAQTEAGNLPVASGPAVAFRGAQTGPVREVHRQQASVRTRDHEPSATPRPSVSVAVSVDTGPSYRVRRVDFRGHGDVSDSKLRRAFRLDEGEPLDLGKLRDGLARLSRLPALEPLSQESIQIRRDPSTAQADLTIAVREKKRGRWSLSGPLGPISLSGPVQFMLQTRLPSWGAGLLDLSSYAAFVSLSSFSLPVLRVFDWQRESLWQPLVGVSRAYLPGREWRSGFIVSPQLDTRATLAAYGMTQARERLSSLLEVGTSDQAELVTPVFHRNRPASSLVYPDAYLLCPPPRRPFTLLRRVGRFASRWLLASPY